MDHCYAHMIEEVKYIVDPERRLRTALEYIGKLAVMSTDEDRASQRFTAIRRLSQVAQCPGV